MKSAFVLTRQSNQIVICAIGELYETRNLDVNNLLGGLGIVALSPNRDGATRYRGVVTESLHA